MYKCIKLGLVALALVVLTVVSATGALASLPYYNQELGYTIWLPKPWQEASADVLSDFSSFDDGLAADMVGWEAGYVLNGPGTVRLLVSELNGKVVNKSTIGNFNRHVVRQIKQASAQHQDWSDAPAVLLKKANFDSGKNMLRLEMDRVDTTGHKMTSVVYIVYTRHTMLKFVGLVEPGNVEGIAAIDSAVSNLYLDRGL